MISLSHYINERLNITDFDKIDNEILCESLNDPKLIELAKDLKKAADKNSWNDFSFAGIFGRQYVPWDKIKESDWKEITDVKKAQREIGKIVTSSDRNIDALAIIKHKDKIRFLITHFNCWDLYHFQQYWGRDKDGEYKELSKVGPKVMNWLTKQSDKKDLMGEGDTCYILDLSKYKQEINKLKSQRIDAKDGLVLQGDSEYYSKIAKENVERYKKIIAQNKANKSINSDTYCERVNELVNKALEVSTEIYKGGAKYADLEYEIAHVIESIYRTKTYTSKGPTGTNGVLVLFNNYLKTSMSIVKNGGYNHERSSLESTKKELEKQLDDLENRISKIEDSMSSK